MAEPIHTNQTTKQPVFFRCPNPECVAHANEQKLKIKGPVFKRLDFFDFESDQAVCPLCGIGPPAIQKRTLIHLLLRDNKGPISGDLGLRWKMACDPKRTHLATLDNGEAASGDSSVINCPGCVKATEGRPVISGQTFGMEK